MIVILCELFHENVSEAAYQKQARGYQLGSRDRAQRETLLGCTPASARCDDDSIPTGDFLHHPLHPAGHRPRCRCSHDQDAKAPPSLKCGFSLLRYTGGKELGNLKLVYLSEYEQRVPTLTRLLSSALRSPGVGRTRQTSSARINVGLPLHDYYSSVDRSSGPSSKGKRFVDYVTVVVMPLSRRSGAWPALKLDFPEPVLLKIFGHLTHHEL